MTFQFINPRSFLTEVWYMPLILLWIYVYLGQKDSYYHAKLLLISFFLVSIRPAFSVFLAVTIVMLFYHTCKEKTIDKKSWLVIAGFCLLFAVNVFVNYGEVGSFVFLENYAGSDVYLANSPNTKTFEYGSDRIDDFATPEFWELQNNTSLTKTEKNKRFSDLAKEYIRNNPGSVLKNTLYKFNNFFVSGYDWDIWIGALAFLLLKLADKKRMFVVLLIAALEGFITSMGLYIPRYGVFILPIFIIFKLWFIVRIIELGTQFITLRKARGLR